MLGLKLEDEVRLKNIKEKLKFQKNVLYFMKRLKWDWVRYLCKLRDNRRTQKITFWYLKGGRKPDKQKDRWMDNICKFIKNKLFYRVFAD